MDKYDKLRKRKVWLRKLKESKEKNKERKKEEKTPVKSKALAE